MLVKEIDMKKISAFILVCTVAACGGGAPQPRATGQPLSDQQILNAAAIYSSGNACAQRGFLTNPAALAVPMNMSKSGLDRDPQRAAIALQKFATLPQNVTREYCQKFELRMAQETASFSAQVRAMEQNQAAAILQEQRQAQINAQNWQNLQNAQNTMNRAVYGY